ncbi:MAG: DUF547 domain-containing protein [Chloroflexi bacterium]|nr:DUF547 domain-containing protein [Chloroflexota bacterium]
MSCATQPTPTRWPLRALMTLTGVRGDEALNCDGHGTVPVSDMEISARLKQATNRLKAQGIDSENGRVDYRALAGSSAFSEYKALTYALRDFDPAALTSDAERMAFWINLYNALMIHAVIAYGVRRSVNDDWGFFDRTAYIVGGYRFSANDIEHGILRANAGHPALPGPWFRADDARQAFCMRSIDVRLHFALVCAAKSCPPIAFYEAERLETQLEVATRNFMSGGGVEIDRAQRIVGLSRIFSWYAADFGARLFGYWQQERLLEFAARYAGEDADFLRTPGLRVRFLRYDWTLNV